MRWWLTPVNTPVVEQDEAAPLYWVRLENAWHRFVFWFRGDPQRIFDKALETNITHVEVTAEAQVNEWRTE